MILVAMLFALVLKIPAKEEEDGEREVFASRKLPEKIRRELRRPGWRYRGPLPRTQLIADRERYLQISKWKTLLSEILFYTVFLGILFASVYYMVALGAYEQTQVIQGLFEMQEVHYTLFL